jgi:hypothetical protein
MAVGIWVQPGANSVVAAYRPITFLISANQMPNNGNASPVVVADLYFDGLYYSSLSVTDFEPSYFFWFWIYFYSIDIQDKVQEYLKSHFARMYQETKGDMDNGRDRYSCSVQVQFREGFIDANGFTQMYGTAPVQGTKFTAPVAGTGTISSNTFYALNATLQHSDNHDLTAHLNEFKDPFQSTLPLSHRPNFISNIGKRIAGGKYYVCKNDRDFIFVFGNGNAPPTWYISLQVKYKNGTSQNGGIVLYPNTTVAANPYKVFSLDSGVPNMTALFSNINWNNVVEYEVFVGAPFFQSFRQYYYVDQCGCCDEYVRIFFMNNLGTYDGINFEYNTEQNKTQSSSWRSSNSIYSVLNPSKAESGNNRMQVTQSDLYEAQCKCYGEEDMNWIKELLGTPRAYIQWNGGQGVPAGLLPIIIEDGEIRTLKTNDRYEYIINIKYRLANERINLRN